MNRILPALAVLVGGVTTAVVHAALEFCYSGDSNADRHVPTYSTAPSPRPA